jgi:hypothetical protein
MCEVIELTQSPTEVEPRGPVAGAPHYHQSAVRLYSVQAFAGWTRARIINLPSDFFLAVPHTHKTTAAIITRKTTERTHTCMHRQSYQVQAARWFGCVVCTISSPTSAPAGVVQSGPVAGGSHLITVACARCIAGSRLRFELGAKRPPFGGWGHHRDASIRSATGN